MKKLTTNPLDGNRGTGTFRAHLHEISFGHVPHGDMLNNKRVRPLTL